MQKITHLDMGKALVEPTEKGFEAKSRHSFGITTQSTATRFTSRRCSRRRKLKPLPIEEEKLFEHKRVLTNVMPLEIKNALEKNRRARHSDLLLGRPAQVGNFVGFAPADITLGKTTDLLQLPTEAPARTTTKKPRRKIIDVTEVSDFQPMPFGPEKPWETVHDGVLKNDMAGMRLKLENGYQYELGNKFPFQWECREVPIKPEPTNLELPELATGMATPNRRSACLSPIVVPPSVHNLQQTTHQANAVKYRRMLHEKRNNTASLDADGDVFRTFAPDCKADYSVAQETEPTGRFSLASQTADYRVSHVPSEFFPSTVVHSPRGSDAYDFRPNRLTIPSGLKTYEQSLDNTCELAAEQIDDNPFQMAEDCDEPPPTLNTDAFDTLAPPNSRFSVRQMNTMAQDFMRHSRNSQSPRGRVTMPAQVNPPPKLTMERALDDYLARCKSPEQFADLRSKQNSVLRQRIQKCNKTIKKCQVEQERLL